MPMDWGNFGARIKCESLNESRGQLRLCYTKLTYKRSNSEHAELDLPQLDNIPFTKASPPIHDPS